MVEVIDKRVGGAEGVGNLEDGGPNANPFGNLLAEAQRLGDVAREMRAKDVLTQQPGAAEAAPEPPVEEVKDALAPEPALVEAEKVEEGEPPAAQGHKKEAGGVDTAQEISTAEPLVEQMAVPGADADGGVNAREEDSSPEEEAPEVTASALEVDSGAPAGGPTEAEPEKAEIGAVGDEGEGVDNLDKEVTSPNAPQSVPDEEFESNPEPPAEDEGRSKATGLNSLLNRVRGLFRRQKGGVGVTVAGADGAKESPEYEWIWSDTGEVERRPVLFINGRKMWDGDDIVVIGKAGTRQRFEELKTKDEKELARGRENPGSS